MPKRPKELKKPKETKAQLRATYEAIAEHFSATRYKPWPEVELFLKKLPGNLNLLDFGAGNGRHSVLAAYLGHKVTAIDFSAAMLKIIKKRDPRIKTLKADVTAVPLPSKSFDVILYIATIHHLPSEKDRLRSLLEARRLLKAGGKILISAWALEQERFEQFAKAKQQDVTLTWAKKWPRFVHLFAAGELPNLAEKAEFKISRAWRSGGNWWVVGFV